MGGMHAGVGSDFFDGQAMDREQLLFYLAKSSLIVEMSALNFCTPKLKSKVFSASLCMSLQISRILVVSKEIPSSALGCTSRNQKIAEEIASLAAKANSFTFPQFCFGKRIATQRSK